MDIQLCQTFELEVIPRIFLAVLLGALIGIERERRSKNAGVRTHIVVAMTSALMMIVSKYGFFDVLQVEGTGLDVSRIAAGVVTAIGFLGAGVIFTRKENTSGVTTAAGIWATVGVGIAAGAGLYFTSTVFTLILILIQFLLHSRIFVHHPIYTVEFAGVIQDSSLSLDTISRAITGTGLAVRTPKLEVKGDGIILYSCRMYFSHHGSLDSVREKIAASGVDMKIVKLIISQ